MQDAVPVRLGESFGAFAQIFREHQVRITTAAADLTKLGLGGSAVGTGMNTHPAYRSKVAQILGEINRTTPDSRTAFNGGDAEYGTVF